MWRQKRIDCSHVNKRNKVNRRKVTQVKAHENKQNKVKMIAVEHMKVHINALVSKVKK